MKKVLLALLGLSVVGCVPYQDGGSTDADDGETITSLDDVGSSSFGEGQINSVWTLPSLQCAVQGDLMMKRDINEPFIQASKIVTLSDVRVNYEVTVPPGREVTVKLVKDNSRGLEDQYILLSEGLSKPAYGAVVVTELPQNFTNPENMFPVIQKMQEQNAGKSLDFYKTVVDSVYGPALEFIVPGRTSGLCFPTSPYVKSDDDTVTISRFIIQRDRLVEFSLVLDVPGNTTRSEVSKLVRASMEEFWSGFSSM